MRLHKLLLPAMASLLLTLPAWADDAPAPVHIEKRVHKPVPELVFFDANGAKQTLQPSAKLTILHFWATWCIPCVKELPELDKVAGDYQAKGVQVVALALDGANMDRIRSYYASHNITHLGGNYDKDNAALRTLEGRGLPFTVFINAKGEEIARATGPVDWQGKEAKEFLEGALH